jgi:hypothetical protein
MDMTEESEKIICLNVFSMSIPEVLVDEATHSKQGILI